MSTEGYLTVIGGDLNGQHIFVGDETEIHHIPAQSIAPVTDTFPENVNPTWTQEQYTKRHVEIGDEYVEFLGLSGWSDATCISHLIYSHNANWRNRESDGDRE